MNMNLDDPKLTAYALDELSDAEKAEIETAVASSPEAQEFVREMRLLSGNLRAEYAAERDTWGISSPKLVPFEEKQRTMEPVSWLALAAAIALCACLVAVAIGTMKHAEFARGGRLKFPALGPKIAATDVSQTPVEGIEEAYNLPAEEEPPPPPDRDFTLQEPSPPPAGPKAFGQVAAAAPWSDGRINKAYNEIQNFTGRSRAALFGPAQEDYAGGASTIYDADAVAGVVNIKPRHDYKGAPTQPATQDFAGYAKPSALLAGGSSYHGESVFNRDRTQDFNTARYGNIEENPFLAAATNPLSTFSIDIDTASYSNIRRFLENGSLPPKDAVRVEEMINYFAYDYPQPNDGAPFSINLDAASCPWAPAHRLVRIGLKGREMPNEKRPASNLVFLLDVSGSMEPANRLPLIKQAMRLLVDKLGENDRVAVVVYAGASGLVLPSTAGDRKEQILAALENLQAGGSTNGAQGIELAYQTAAEHFIKGGVNRVILATDGDFNIGTTSEGDLVRLIQEKAKGGVFLSVLGVGDDNLNDSMMQKLADKGNGNYAYLDSLDEARKVLVQQINGTLVTIAKDVKIQVEFNPARVASYRLVGYEKRMLRKEDFNDDKIDAGEIGAGHTVTALYEVVTVGSEPNPAASVPPVDPLKYQTGDKREAAPMPAFRTAKPLQELLTVKLRYKQPDGDTSKLIERPFVDSGAPFASAAPDLKFAAAVAEFGMILRDSEFKGSGTLGALTEWAREGKGADANGYRAGFLELVRKAQELKARM